MEMGISKWVNRLSLTCESSNIVRVKELVKSILPECKVISDSAGSLIFGVRSIDFVKLIPFFEIVQRSVEDPRLKEVDKLVINAGISHSSIDDVFLKISNKEKKSK